LIPFVLIEGRRYLLIDPIGLVGGDWNAWPILKRFFLVIRVYRRDLVNQVAFGHFIGIDSPLS